VIVKAWLVHEPMGAFVTRSRSKGRTKENTRIWRIELRLILNLIGLEVFYNGRDTAAVLHSLPKSLDKCIELV
jgi:hypothetical protein